MSEYSEEEQLTQDLDWFAVDAANRIGHFSTAGFRLLPKWIASNKEDLAKIYSYFIGLPVRRRSCHLNENLSAHVSWKITREYKGHYEGMASRGMYSFDGHARSSYAFGSPPYFKVASPKRELLLEEMPVAIRVLLLRGVIPAIFAEVETVSEGILGL